jgi:phage RecT family recombinase
MRKKLIEAMASNLDAKTAFLENFRKDDAQAFNEVARSLYTFALSFEDRINPLAATMTAANYIIANKEVVRMGTAEQVIAAFCEACSLGVQLDKASGNAYLVPYKKNIQLVLGYRFLLELAKRDNPNLTIVIGFVTKEEKPYYRSEEAGDKTLVFHKKFGNRDIMDTDNIVLLYAKIYQHGKLIDVKEMPRRRMEYLRSLSPNSESAYSPWKQHLYAMWQAKLMRESLKLLVTMPMERPARVDMTSNDLNVEYDDYEMVDKQEEEDMQRFEEVITELQDIYDRDAFTKYMTETCKKFGAESSKYLPQVIIDAAKIQFGTITEVSKIAIPEDKAAYIETCKQERMQIRISEEMLKNQ